MIRELLGIGFGILDHLYQEWLDREDGFYAELREYACYELEAIPKKNRAVCGRGGETWNKI